MAKDSETTPIEGRFRFRIEMGKRLEKLRLDVNVSPQYLADRLGYKTYTSITNIEAGTAALPMWALETTCEVLGCTLEQLLGINPRSARRGRRNKTKENQA